VTSTWGRPLLASVAVLGTVNLLCYVAVTEASFNAGTRTVTLLNSCSQNVRVGLTVGAIPGSACDNDSQCPSTGMCNTEARLCFYRSFLPNGFYDLAPKETYSTTVSISDNQMYSGALYVSTGCDTYSNACETGICKGKSCSPFTGTVGPHTRAEFTFNPSGKDFYDISLMHGVNVPMSMQAVGGDVVSSDPYSCGTAGSVKATSSLPGCNYGYVPTVNGVDQTSNVVYVAPLNLTNVVRCNSDADCGGQTCGLAAGRDPTGLPTTEVYKACGSPVGVWSADEVCIYSNGGYSESPYFCDKMANLARYTELYGCAGAYSSSGYQPDSNDANTCGCQNWEGMPTESQCKHSNIEWEDIVLPWATFIKNICPVAYSYAYDDMTSTFTCGGNVNYVVEMCPSGVELHKA
jgi:hypothetical protein